MSRVHCFRIVAAITPESAERVFYAPLARAVRAVRAASAQCWTREEDLMPLHSVFAVCMVDTNDAPKKLGPFASLYYLQNRTVLGSRVWASDRETAKQFSTRATAAREVQRCGRRDVRVMRIAVSRLD